MNKITLFYFLCFLPLITLAQKKQIKKDDFQKINYLEIGVNISGAIGTFVQNRTDSIYSDPYAIVAKYVNHNFGVRLGVGYALNSVKEINAIQARVDGLKRLDVRGGLDYQHKINKHWRLHYGADVLFGSIRGKKQFSEGDNIYQIRITEKMIGLGPILGIQFHLTPRISLQTEAALYAMSTITMKEYYNSARPDLKFTDKVTQLRFPPGIPRSIAVIVRF
ncbi:MAG: hypothetical protein ACOYOA_01175 [Saprospiraceae bacterium]